MVVECEAGFIAVVGVVVGLDDRSASGGGAMEGCVPGWQEGVAKAEGLGDCFFIGVAGEIWFSAAGGGVGVGAEEGLESAGRRLDCPQSTSRRGVGNWHSTNE